MQGVVLGVMQHVWAVLGVCGLNVYEWMDAFSNI